MATSVAGILATTSEIVGVRGAPGGGPNKRKLVGRADHEVAAPRLDVDEVVRREVDGVHERQRLGLVSHGDRPGDVVDGPHGVGCGADGQQLGSMLAQAAVKIVPVELAGLGNP